MVNHEIIGDDMQAVIISLAHGDQVRAEAGGMMFMSESIEMDAKMEGGFLGGLKRKFLAGESFIITHFRATNGPGRVAFAGPYPGRLSWSTCSLADRIHAAYRGDRGEVKRDLGRMLGGLIGGDR